MSKRLRMRRRLSCAFARCRREEAVSFRTMQHTTRSLARRSLYDENESMYKLWLHESWKLICSCRSASEEGPDELAVLCEVGVWFPGKLIRVPEDFPFEFLGLAVEAPVCDLHCPPFLCCFDVFGVRRACRLLFRRFLGVRWLVKISCCALARGHDWLAASSRFRLVFKGVSCCFE